MEENSNENQLIKTQIKFLNNAIYQVISNLNNYYRVIIYLNLCLYIRVSFVST